MCLSVSSPSSTSVKNASHASQKVQKRGVDDWYGSPFGDSHPIARVIQIISGVMKPRYAYQLMRHIDLSMPKRSACERLVDDGISGCRADLHAYAAASACIAIDLWAAYIVLGDRAVDWALIDA